MPLQATSGAASYDAFGGGVAAVPNYIEDVFSTYLYTGTGVARTITNGIDLSTKGGLVWTKRRSTADYHALFDTARTINYALYTNTTSAQTLESNSMTSYGTSGYSIGTGPALNSNTNTFVSWTFRKQPKFFDVVTYTGTGSARTVSHNLGSAVGFLIVKRTDAAGESWRCWHRSGGANNVFTLNSTDAKYTDSSGVFWNLTAPTSTQFSVGTETSVNASGGTYVAYLFAHNAGGFGLTGTDNVISCGSVTIPASGTIDINLGYEPQFVMLKATNYVDGWYMFDTMRGWTNGGSDAWLYANSSAAEASAALAMNPTATGFNIGQDFGATVNYIYIAIRRGPMKVPTSGTSVFDADAYTGNSTARVITTGFPSDLNIMANRTSDGLRSSVWDRLRGFDKFLATSNTGVETTYATEAVYFDNNSGYGLSTSTSQGLVNFSGYGGYVGWAFRRAPSFFDEVCYTGTGSNATINHNLGVAPELIIVKSRSNATGWPVWCANAPSPTNGQYAAFLNATGAYADQGAPSTWGTTVSRTATTFSIGSVSETNFASRTYVAYLFATCAGVSKVGSYTGNGSSQTINCGFTGGARFVLIKRTDSTGDWYVWDTARGIVAGNDPHLSLNTSSAEVTTDDTIDTNSTGFVVNQLAATNVNVTSATYIFLAIA